MVSMMAKGGSTLSLAKQGGHGMGRLSSEYNHHCRGQRLKGGEGGGVVGGGGGQEKAGN